MNIFHAIFTLLVYALLAALAYFGVLLVGDIIGSVFTLAEAAVVTIAKIVAALVFVYGVGVAFGFISGWRIGQRV